MRGREGETKEGGSMRAFFWIVLSLLCELRCEDGWRKANRGGGWMV